MSDRTIRVVGVKDGDLYFVQALEVDIAAQGRTMDEAAERFRIALNAEQREADACGRDLFDIGPGPASFQDLYDDNPLYKEKLVA